VTGIVVELVIDCSQTYGNYGTIMPKNRRKREQQNFTRLKGLQYCCIHKLARTDALTHMTTLKGKLEDDHLRPDQSLYLAE
jgi:hypothetical protein